ncbi:MAG: DUF423 domain-containing protein [Myxococcales bacterium]|nr:DUF423 domain-containing protein [Myxococcales bacterium]
MVVEKEGARDTWLFPVGAVVALLAVAFGAFGAHALEGKLDARALRSFETAARYQMYHAVALLLTGLATAQWPHQRATRVAGIAFSVGLVAFCGSLYALAFGSPRAFGAVAPVGGISFMIGWGALAVAGVVGSRPR